MLVVNTAEQLTALLAQRLLGWGVAPDRFTTGNRGWIRRGRFQPLQDLNNAFQLVDAADPDSYVMGCDRPGEFWVRVEIGETTGEARHASKPRAITFAVARALGIVVEAAG